MQTVGVRELKARASEIIAAVEARGTRFQVTKRGKPVAIIAPVRGATLPEDSEPVEGDLDVWAEMDELAAEIGRRWPQGLSAVEALAQDRE